MATTSEERQYRRPRVSIKQEQDDDSDTEESHLGFRKSDGRDSQIIHSGHFMVSSPHIEHPPKKGYDFDTVNKQTCRTYHFGKTSTSHLSIDASLTKLFECMTLAYSGKLVSPKWKNFKGLKLLWRDKIRLNNAIWRAWYMQYVEKRENPVCHFVTPLDGTMDTEDHRPAEAIATEGKYWKRRIEIVIREYHKWRTYFKKRLQKHKDDDLSSLLKDDEMAGRRVARKSRESPVPMEMDPLFDMDVLMSEFSDTLFSTLASHQHLAWPNPREIAHAGNADMIQPGLIPLQPNLDFMDSFEPLQGNVLCYMLRDEIISLSRVSTFNLKCATLFMDTFTNFSPVCTTRQGQLLSSMHLSAEHSLDHRLIAAPVPLSVSSHIDSQASEPSDASSYMQNYMPLFSGPVPPSVQAGSSSHMQPSAPPILPHSQPCQGADKATKIATSPLDETTSLDASPPPSVNAQTPSSPCTPSEAIVFSQGSEFSALTRAPPTALLGPQSPSPAAPLQHPLTFALPRPIQPSCSNKKTRHVQRIVPANPVPSSHLILTGESACAKRKNRSICFYLLWDLARLQRAVPFCNITTRCRRGTHISAEQKRRFNINIGFKTLCSMISNAATLQKTVEYIGKLQQERQQMQEETKRLREEIEELNASINVCQELLPATGVPITRHRFDYMREKFDEYVKSRTLQNWKFWIFSIIIKPLFESFNGAVSTTSKGELCETTLQWLDRHCSLPVLRPMVLSTLRQLSTSTSILTDPSLLPEEATQAANNTHRHSADS
uniref:BHLH domain-containing protein n=1 Tax=Esox lucius TaxID=8010 RepID=A0A6Q2YDQ0_ESOLU